MLGQSHPAWKLNALSLSSLMKQDTSTTVIMRVNTFWVSTMRKHGISHSTLTTLWGASGFLTGSVEGWRSLFKVIPCKWPHWDLSCKSDSELTLSLSTTGREPLWWSCWKKEMSFHGQGTWHSGDARRKCCLAKPGLEGKALESSVNMVYLWGWGGKIWLPQENPQLVGAFLKR